MSAALFDGVKVLDLSQEIAGPFCARLLADFGAECLKAEPAGGDPGRRLPPFAGDEPDPEKSLLFTFLNVNKRGVVLDLETELGRERLKRLAREYDVVVESFDPGYLDERGVGWKALHTINPRLILTSITPFGQTGPYAGYLGSELLMYALSGVMSYSGKPGREPIKHGGPQAQYEGGLNGAAATSVALLQRERTGNGEHVDVALMQSLAYTAIMPQAAYAFAGGMIGRNRMGGGPFNTIVPCKDGYVVLGVPNEAGYKMMAEILGLPQMLEPPFGDPVTRRAHTPELYDIVVERLKSITRKELLLHPRKPLIGDVQTPKDLLECPQLESRGFYREIEQPSIGKLKMPFALFNGNLSTPQLRMPAPRLGEHDREVFAGSAEFALEGSAERRSS